jgi:hypothetical protein
MMGGRSRGSSVTRHVAGRRCRGCCMVSGTICHGSSSVPHSTEPVPFVDCKSVGLRLARGVPSGVGIEVEMGVRFIRAFRASPATGVNFGQARHVTSLGRGAGESNPRRIDLADFVPNGNSRCPGSPLQRYGSLGRLYIPGFSFTQPVDWVEIRTAKRPGCWASTRGTWPTAAKTVSTPTRSASERPFGIVASGDAASQREGKAASALLAMPAMGPSRAS